MFSKNLKALREANELTQDQLATYLGVQRSAYANYESGARNMPLPQMQKAADLFGCSLSALLSEDPNEVNNILSFAFPVTFIADNILQVFVHIDIIGADFGRGVCYHIFR